MTDATYSPAVRAALAAVDEDALTRQPDGSLITQSSAREIIATMLDHLDIHRGHRVLEIGTGTSYSTALAAHLVGPHGHVVTIDIDPDLTARAARLLASHGGATTTVLCGDGLHGAPKHAPFDRIIAWATAEHLPSSWVSQANPHAVIVTPVEVAPLAKATAVLRAHLTADGLPVGDELLPGGFVELHHRVLDQWLVPPRHLDAHTTDPDGHHWWISTEWLRAGHTDTAAGKALLDLLATGQHHTIPGPLHPDENPADFTAYLLAARPDGLTTAALGTPTWHLGHTTPTTVALAPKSHPYHTVSVGPPSDDTSPLHQWADDWRREGRPGHHDLHPALTPTTHGWTIRATYRK